MVFEVERNNAYLTGLYSVASLLEHSCTPNAKVKFSSSNNLTVKACAPIITGENISIMYTNMQWGTQARTERTHGQQILHL